MQSRKRLSVREAFCPLGCKTSTGSTRKVGSGSCDECFKFNAQTVLQQDMTSRLLIQNEDAVNLEASKKFIPTPPTSPSGKTNREMDSTIKDAQCFVASTVHRQLTACGTPSPTSLLPLPVTPVSVPVAKKKTDVKKNIASAAVPKNNYSEFDLDDDDNATTREMTAIYGTEVVCRDAGDWGQNGLFFLVDLPKGKKISVYDGHRTSMEGKIQLQCPRMVKLIQQHPLLATVPFTKSHLMLVPGETRNMVIAGAASAHPMLQRMPRHGDIGTGSCINSTQRTGLKHNCKATWVERLSNEILKNVTGMTFEPDFYYELVFYLTEDVKAGQQALYYYNCDSHPPPAPPFQSSSVPQPEVAPKAKRPLVVDKESVPLPQPEVAPKAKRPLVDKESVPLPRPDVAPKAKRPLVDKESVPLPQPDFAPKAPLDDDSDGGDRGDSDAPAPGVTGNDEIQEYSNVKPQTRTEERLKTAGNLSLAHLKILVKEVLREVPSIVPKQYQLSNVDNNYSKELLNEWCVHQAQRMESARVRRFKVILIARDSVEVVIRMLAIFVNDQYMQDLYLQSRLIPTQGAFDAGKVGDGHPFWTELHERFHNTTDYHLPFPYDYIPTKFKHQKIGGFEREFEPPLKVKEGFLQGLDLKHARKPSQFALDFFSKIKLIALWKGSLADYRAAYLNWSKSGTNMSQPFYHYVLPATLFDPDHGQSYGDHVLKMATKRWDTLAWQQIIFHKGDFEKSFNVATVSGGFGTAASTSSKQCGSEEGPRTVRKLFNKKQKQSESEEIPKGSNLMTLHLAEFMSLNETKANLILAMSKCSAADNVCNNLVTASIDKRRLELASLMQAPETSSSP